MNWVYLNLCNRQTLVLKNTITLIFLFFFAEFSFAKDPIMFSLNKEVEIPTTQIYSIQQDDHDFLWFATAEGLYRYDGKEFLHFDNPDKKGISVFNLKVDDHGKVWCTNMYGEFYYVEGRELRFFYDVATEFNLPERIYEYDFFNGMLLIYGESVEVKIDLVSKQSQIRQQEDLNTYRFSRLLNLQDTIYIPRVKQNHLVLDYYTKELKRPHSKSIPFSLNRLRDADGQLLTQDGILYFQREYPKSDSSLLVFEKYKSYAKKTPSVLKGKRVINANFYDDDDLWYSTNNGLYVLGIPSQSDSLHLKHHLLPGKTITQVFKDKQDVYWVSTLNSGLYVLPNVHFFSHKINSDVGVPTVLASLGKQNIAIGTSLGYLCIYDAKKSEFEYIKLPTQRQVMKLFYNTAHQQVYISTADTKQNYVYNLATKSISLKQTPDTNISAARNLFTTQPNQLYFSNFQSEYLLKINSSGFYNRVLINRENSVSEKIFQSLYDKENNEFYVGYVNGLKVYDSDQNMTNIQLDNGEAIKARSITQAENGDIWVAASHLGLVQIRDKKVYQVFNLESGLLSDKILQIKAFEKKVWFITDKGLQFYDVDQKYFSNAIAKAEGMPTSNIIDFHVNETALWFITDQGLYSIDTSKGIKSPMQLKTSFSKIIVNDKSIGLRNKFSLTGNQEKIEFQFKTNQLVDRQAVQYQYRLFKKGEENSLWITLPRGVDFVLLNSLNAGQYQFQVRSFYLNNFSQTKQIQFKLVLPFYKQWWFYTFAGLSFLCVLGFYFRKTLQKKEEEAKGKILEHKREIEETIHQLDTLESNLNPSFVSNTLNSIQQFILLNKNETAKTYVNKLSSLISMYSDYKDLDTVSLEKAVIGLEQYLEIERLRFGNRFHYTLQLDPNVDPVDVLIPPMLIFPYVENAVQYGLHTKGAKGWLVICFSIQDNKLICEIHDDGIGRDKAKELMLTNSMSFHSFTTNRNPLVEFADRYNVDVHMQDVVENSVIVGTKVTLKIPFKSLNKKQVQAVKAVAVV